jgi:hypothetical protein
MDRNILQRITQLTQKQPCISHTMFAGGAMLTGCSFLGGAPAELPLQHLELHNWTSKSATTITHWLVWF